MQRYVEIVFDCLPLRSISRLDIPIDASPRYRAALRAAQKRYRNATAPTILIISTTPIAFFI